MSFPDASAWSKHSSRYNNPDGEPLSLPMVQSAFEAHWFQQLNVLIEKKKSSGPLKVLLLACGTGAELQVLCNKYNESQLDILATDFAAGMVETTQEYVDREQKQAMVKVRVMDAMNIEAEESTFDVVFLVLGPMLMPDPPHVFKEIQRVLVPGGWSAYLTPSNMETHDVMTNVRKEYLQKVGRLESFVNFYDTQMMKTWGSPEAVKAKLEAANFDRIESNKVHSVLTWKRGEGINEMLDHLFENPGMTKFYTHDMTDQEIDQFKVRVRESFHSNWPVSQDPLPAEPYVTAIASSGYKL